ncbi:diacylglycerol kinase [Arthrobacter sp. cf158]|uniref:diacylglycerol/lipid kinase family protein n=1 Tax=Arthrobacter sp. cf158 TaxID=1761744 RepID=UPI00089C638C|nr:YegS/Rv2252/BmrU family lipid kinase [Arthrobacter sp. cf158]SDW30589.1 diacylglycerol kinase [Arthrobacter sp. cf158]
MTSPEPAHPSNKPGKIALAINPGASFGRTRDAGDHAAQYFRAAGRDVVVLEADSYDALQRIVRDALAPGSAVEALVVVGGDGMVHLGVNALAGLEIPLGIVPSGTGNDVARLLSLPLADTAAACSRVLAAMATGGRRIDVGRVTAAGRTTRFAGVLSAGFDAAVNERANSWRWPRGKSRYNLAMLRELGSFRRIEYTVTADGTTWKQPALLISVANGQFIGGGMQITPDALPDDGWLDLFVVRPLSRLRFLAVFPKVFAGKHTSHPAVEIKRVRNVRLEAAGVVAYADGERLASLPVEVDVIPGGLRVLA